MVLEIVLALGAGCAVAAWEVLRSRGRRPPPERPPARPYRDATPPSASRTPESGGFPTPPFGDDE